MAKIKVDQVLLRAKTHERKGETQQARALYKSVLDVFPKNARAKQALVRLTSSKNAAIGPPQNQINALMTLVKVGNMTAVVEQVTPLLKQYPRSVPLWNILGGAQKGLGHLTDAEHAFRKTTELSPTSHTTFGNLAAVLVKQGKADEALTAYQKALASKPDYVEAHFGMGNAFKALERFEDAVRCYQRALQLQPTYANALNNMGNVLMAMGRPDEALKAYQRLITLKPTDAKAHNNMGGAFSELDKTDNAIAAYQRAIDIKPDYAEAHGNLGVALNKRGKADDALAAFQRALKLNPTHFATLNNMGNVLKIEGRLDSAIKVFQRALDINPNHATTLYNIGHVYRKQDRLDKAIIAFQRAHEINPNDAEREAQMLHWVQHCCDWSRFDQFESNCARLGITSDAVAPFAMLSMEDNPERQMRRAQAWAQQNYKREPATLPIKPATKPDRIRIGYFSADFHDHPMLYLMLGMLRNHDTSRFEIFAYSYGKRQAGGMREQAIQAVDHFIDIADMGDDDVVDLARSHKLDIAIDRKGYTRNTRCNLFQLRLAPVQVAYLAFPGTMGADFIDYVVADPTVIPQDKREYYTENIIYMPHSYQPNDDKREIAKTPTTRADFGLPEDGFVFCCFNNNYKISPREFDIWMRLLGKVEGSVLWLLRANTWSEANLRREVKARGIDPDRLVLAEKLPHAEHLARHKHADLFVDTFNYNAHTTTSDALWSGLPVVTKIGAQFAARVAAGLLKAVDLPELITTTEQDYEALILDLATNPDKLAAIKDKLAANRLTQPLFDTQQYTRDFEYGLQQAYDLYFDGKDPQDIWAKANTPEPRA